MKKICIITAARSEYGLLKWVIDGVHHNEELQLQLVVTGAHLSVEHGYTVQFIEEDGYPIAARVDMHLASENRTEIVRSMGHCSIGMADTLSDLNPDMVVVLGDRYELLPIVSAAMVLGIPVAHLSGGDVTEGAIDNEVRNAVSMMSSLHFPGVESSAENLRRMLGTDRHIFTTGEPGLESFLHYELMSREELAENIGLDVNKPWCLVTLHPETKISIEENVALAENLFRVMEGMNNVQFVISKANADYGGSQINAFWDKSVAKNTEKYKLFTSLGQRRYLSFMRQAAGVLGNSSSGIVEAPFMGIPVVNIGDRQKGRHLCKNVIQCGRSYDEILDAVNRMQAQPKMVDTYYGDGHTAEKVIAHIKEYLHEK
jgi:UDP-hydrolysing UDP-N-acetyl-D-glucosamine 2-epimerase